MKDEPVGTVGIRLNNLHELDLIEKVREKARLEQEQGLHGNGNLSKITKELWRQYVG